MKRVFLLIGFLSLYSQISFAGENYEDEMVACLTQSDHQDLCEAMGCHYAVLNSSVDGTERTLCISINRMKQCLQLSKNIHRCQSKGCFYDFNKNLCYPTVIRVLPEEYWSNRVTPFALPKSEE